MPGVMSTPLSAGLVGVALGVLAGAALVSMRRRGAAAAASAATVAGVAADAAPIRPSGRDSRRGRILVTGGTGYIGSHTVLQLLDAGFHVTIVDNLCNSSLVCLERVRELSGKGDMIDFFKVDLMDTERLDEVFTVQPRGFDAVIHFAALKAVGESVEKPLMYYENNLTGTFNLLSTMRKHACKTIVFSSSATVYGTAPVPISEDSDVGVGITNPYGQTKFMMEQVLRDVQRAESDWRVVLLRYFNPVGAHASGMIGEDPKGRPNNLMPFVQQVAVGRRPVLSVFGNSYDTKDGTGVRDYIHVEDLASGHLAALDWVFKQDGICEVFNLGTGNGYTVLEMVAAMEKVSGRRVPYEIAPPRPGDLASVYADPAKAEHVLGWKAKRGIEEMCADAWRWQSQNPNGFSDA